MAYWNQSMGFFLAIGASCFYFFFLGIFMLVDSYTIPYVLERIIARVKRLELKGFKQKPPKKLTVYRDDKGKIVFIRHDVHKEKKEEPEKKQVEEDRQVAEAAAVEDQEKPEKWDPDAVIELKKAGVDLDELRGNKKYADEENVAEAYLGPKAGGTRGKMMRKAFKDEEDDVA